MNSVTFKITAYAVETKIKIGERTLKHTLRRHRTDHGLWQGDSKSFDDKVCEAAAEHMNCESDDPEIEEFWDAIDREDMIEVAKCLGRMRELSGKV